MLKRIHLAVLLTVSVLGLGVMQAQLCPGAPALGAAPKNLACEIADANGTAGIANSSLSKIPSTIATQLGQLPLSTAVSGSGLTLNRSLGVYTASEDSLGTILTQRGETMGRNKLMFLLSYQHFGFDSIDGASLGSLSTVQCTSNTSSTACANNSGNRTYFIAKSNVSLHVEQLTTALSYGLAPRLDVTLVVPFSYVGLSTKATMNDYGIFSGTTYLLNTATYNMPGSANGIGDVAVNLKGNVYKGEKTSLALGAELRFPTGDAVNYLGSGAYGARSYVIWSHRARVTPNINLAYQWNGNSVLNSNTKMPDSFLYSGGVDIRVKPSFTLVGEFTGQYVLDGSRLVLASAAQTTPVPYPAGAVISSKTANYAMDNAGVGFKWKPTKRLFISALGLFKLDNTGLRVKVVQPLVGVSYKF